MICRFDEHLYTGIKINMINENKIEISENLKYHIDNKIPLTKSIFRHGSKAYFETILEAKKLFKENKIIVDQQDEELLMSDIGEKVIYNGEEVFLDIPHINENEYRGRKVDLDKPMRDSSASKPYKVYVRNPDTDNVMVVRFGSGMRAKIDDPDARRRYDKRHGCSEGKHNDKAKPGYWSCRLPRFASDIGLSYSGSARWW